jgi:hypothetical protein
LNSVVVGLIFLVVPTLFFVFWLALFMMTRRTRRQAQ